VGAAARRTNGLDDGDDTIRGSVTRRPDGAARGRGRAPDV